MTAYVQGAPSYSLGPTLSGKPPTVGLVEFVGCTVLTDRLNVYIGLADDTPVCYVELRGPFNLTEISVPSGARPEPWVGETVEEIYDAGTDRLLVHGTGPSKPRPGF
jgi:hypothetical protein